MTSNLVVVGGNTFFKSQEARDALTKAGLDMASVLTDGKLDLKKVAEPGRVVAIVLGTFKFGAMEMDCYPNLKTIARHGIGYENIDVAEARKHGIIVTRTSQMGAGAVADFVITLIPVLSRHILKCHLDLVVGEKWNRVMGRGISDLTVGIAGLGAIGRETAKRLRGLNVKRLLGWNRTERGEVEKARKDFGIERPFALDVLCAESDVVVTTLPANEETQTMFGADLLGKMREESFFINVGRGATVDEDALLCCLEERKIAGAALDVHVKEPPMGTDNFSRFQRLAGEGRVVLTPHFASHAEGVVRAEVAAIVRNVLGVLSGNLEGVEIVPNQ